MCLTLTLIKRSACFEFPRRLQPFRLLKLAQTHQVLILATFYDHIKELFHVLFNVSLSLPSFAKLLSQFALQTILLLFAVFVLDPAEVIRHILAVFLIQQRRHF